ncbi:MAG: MATE family efflux transporter, partial [Halanaerobium sp.]|nr:MATE family efflux transporter [Halanaerobium sp.]
QLAMRTAQILYVRLVSALGTVSFAAHQIAINVESLSYMPGWGFAVAATTMVGQYLGAEREELAEESGYESWKLGASVMGLMAVVFFFFPEYLVRLYTDDPQIIKMAAGNLRIIAFAQIPMGTQFIFAGALRGAGDTRPVFYSTMIGNWLGRLGGAYLLLKYFGLGLTGAWLAMCFDWVIRGIYVWLRYRKGNWKKIQV